MTFFLPLQAFFPTSASPFLYLTSLHALFSYFSHEQNVIGEEDCTRMSETSSKTNLSSYQAVPIKYKIAVVLYIINYLWTFDLYGPAHKDFVAGGWITL
jgi:hypothetical protein